MSLYSTRVVIERGLAWAHFPPLQTTPMMGEGRLDTGFSASVPCRHVKLWGYARTFLLYRLCSDDDRTGVGRQQQWQVRRHSVATGHWHRVATGHTQPHPFLLCVCFRRWRLVLLERCDVNDRIWVHFCWDHKFRRLCLGGRLCSSSISCRTEGPYLANKVCMGRGVYVAPVAVARAGKPYTHPQCQSPQYSQITTGSCEAQVHGVHHGMGS